MTAATRRPNPRSLAALAMAEAELQANIMQAAKTLHWLRYHTHDSHRSPAGFPDLVLVNEHQGRLIFAELKRQTEKQTPEQIDWERQLRAVTAPPEFYLWRPSDWFDGTILAILQRRLA